MTDRIYRSDVRFVTLLLLASKDGPASSNLDRLRLVANQALATLIEASSASVLEPIVEMLSSAPNAIVRCLFPLV